jgi:hypothetical protein
MRRLTNLQEENRKGEIGKKKGGGGEGGYA